MMRDRFRNATGSLDNALSGGSDLKQSRITLIGAVPTHAKRVLELFCGDGETLRLLLKNNKIHAMHVSGVDGSQSQIERAQANTPEGHFQCEDVFRNLTDRKDRSQSAIIVRKGIHEIPKDKQGLLISEIARVLDTDPGALAIWADDLFEEDYTEVMQAFVESCDDQEKIENTNLMQFTARQGTAIFLRLWIKLKDLVLNNLNEFENRHFASRHELEQKFFQFGLNLEVLERGYYSLRSDKHAKWKDGISTMPTVDPRNVLESFTRKHLMNDDGLSEIGKLLMAQEERDHNDQKWLAFRCQYSVMRASWLQE